MGIKSYIFGRTKFTTVVNTFIGGVASTIGTASLLAAKLNIAVSRISLFSVVGSDIQCSISGSYDITQSMWLNRSDITYIIDRDGLVDKVIQGISNNLNLEECYFPKATIIRGGPSGSWLFQLSPNVKTLYVPMITSFGETSGQDEVFRAGFTVPKFIYAHPSLQTNNAGGLDGDLVRAISQGAIVRYVTNFTVPNPVTNLAAGTIYNTAIQLNFTAPSSTNAIDYYEVYVNGVFNINITASGGYATRLTANTSFNFTVVAVDVFYNKSLVSNILVVSTSNHSDSYYEDSVEATTYISATGIVDINQINSAKHLIFQFLNSSLWFKTQALYPFKGSTASQHRFNAKKPLDTNAAFRLLFSGTGVHSALGYAGNGTNAFANTNFIPSTNQNVNSNGLTIVVGTNNAAASSDVFEIGAYSNDSQVSGLAVKADNTTFRRISIFNNNPPRISINGTNEARGIFTGTRINTVQKLIRNTTVLASAIGNGTLPTVPIYIGALNITNSVYGASNQRIQMAIIHEGLSDAEVATLHSIIDISETIAGRKTW